MTYRTGYRSGFHSHESNVGSTERMISTLAGIGLMLSAARGRGMIGRLLRSGAGLSLLARGASGYCAVKGAVNGEGSLTDGLREQLQRLTGVATGGMSTVRGSVLQERARRIDSMSELYAAELQELRHAEMQLASLVERVARQGRQEQLASRMRDYARELQSRRSDIENLLQRIGTDFREHPDEAISALILETDKMVQLTSDKVRDAALAASLQRILHYKIAGYGTIASYAKALGRLAEASHFAQLAERDRQVDSDLSSLAKSSLNVEAVAQQPYQPATAEMRAH
jgi:ferritin-like metal-binding protein YciE